MVDMILKCVASQKSMNTETILKLKKMKAFNKIIQASLLALFFFGLNSCEEADSEKEWGIAKVYMPQAAIKSGAHSNYEVPSGTSEFNKNYFIENNNIKVVLGVYRSGLQELESFSVDVAVRADTLNQLITDGTLADAVALPDDTYTLPGTLTVASGERESIFYLSIDRQKLMNDYPSYVGMRLALAVSIANPSKYELNRSLSTTIVIVNGWETLE